MNTLKIIGTVLLGGLLFISLLVLGLAFTLDSTALNPDFVIGQVNKIDIATVTRDVIDEQIQGQLTPTQENFVKETIYKVVDEQEPWIRQQAENAIRAGYDFFLGKTDSLKITVPLTELKQDVRDSLWRVVTDEPGSWLPIFQDDLNAYIDQHFTALAQEIRPFLPSALASLPIEQLQPQFEAYLLQFEEQIINHDLPPGEWELLLIVARPYFNMYFDELAAEIPDEISADAETIPADTMADLQQVREYIGYFRTGYYLLIAFAVVLAGGIVLINRNVRTPCLALGIVLTAAGALELAATIVARNVSLAELLADIPASLAIWIDDVYRAVLLKPLIFSIVALAVGLVLLVVFFLYHRRNASD